ncbi:PREDICTED: uncharacterized protein LOC109243675 [Nicotiana attenuata]|uniref:uncharacterized protein LOC109243675 n=1 Tax=Nicotiana attenuata TaxID=49451 RepID=UPI000905ADBD|nr:PREDICTED: uncharacterized protein LOC109243675 [Nicotiana attenuata]
MIWYHNLLPDFIDSFAMLTDAFVKAHARAIKVETKKLDLLNVKQRDNEMLREFVLRFQMDRMDLPSVADDWAVLVPIKNRVEDDQLGAPSGSAYPIRTNDRSKRVVDHETRPSKDRYQLYRRDRRSDGYGYNYARNEKNDRGHNSWGLMGKNGFDRPLGAREAPRLSECNFSVDAAGIVSSIGRIKDTKWPRPLHSDLAQRVPNLMCRYHGSHGHRNEDCRELREEVARLFNNRHLGEFLSDRAKNHFRNGDSNKQTK